MTYKIVNFRETKEVKNVKHILDKGDNFTFVGNNNMILLIVPKNQYGYIEKVD